MPPTATLTSIMGIRRAEFDRCFELEVLEPRVMLSGEGMAAPDTGTDGGARIELPADPDTGENDDKHTEGFGLISVALMSEATGPVWINADGGDWSDTANWQDGEAPQAGDDVVITGLDSDATITLTGDTPVLASLTIESGTVVIDGALNTDSLTVRDGATLQITGAGESAVTGAVTIESGATFELSGSSVLEWSAADTVEWDQQGSMILQSGTELRQTTSGNMMLNAGIFHVQAGATVTLVDLWADFYIRGGELRVDGRWQGLGANAEFTFTSGILSGSGSIVNPRPLTIHGTISPGSGSIGTGWLQIAADVNFAENWSVHLDVLDVDTTTSASMDFLRITGAVSFGGTGLVTIDATDADFGSATSGTRVGDANGLFYITGTVTGTPDLEVLPGAQHTVTAEWNAGDNLLDVETYSPITATWTNAAGGDWSESSNWANGRLPVVGEDVIITGLASDATITLTGDTPALGSLSLDAGTLTINGGLNTGNLTVIGGATLNVSGAADSAITGNVSFAAGTSLVLGSGANLTWSGATWQQGGFAQVTAGATLTQTAGRFEISTTEQFAVNGTLNLNGGEFVIPSATSALNIYNAGRLNVGAAIVTLTGGRIAAFNETGAAFAAGSLLRGHGEFRVNEQVTISGTIRPGGAGTSGTLSFTQGEDGVDGDITFTGAWSIELDVVSTASADLLAFDAAVAFGASGSIAVNASTADFTGTPNGTALDPLVTVDGTVTGTPTVTVSGGDDHSVSTNWTGSQLAATTVSTVMTEISQTVSAGLAAGTATYQALLANYNLGTIDLAAQERTPFTLPGLSLNLADALDLTALAAQVALPVISPSATLEQLISDLEAAGFTVTQPGDGVELRATLSRTISDGLTLAVDADEAFDLPADMTAGWADELDLAITGALTAQLGQNIVFEVRDGEFVLAVNPIETSHFYLNVSGTAEVAGSATSGGRTVSVAGDITVAYEIWLHHVSGGPTTKASGTSSIELTSAVGALDLTVAATASRTADTTTLITTSTDTLDLDGVLNFNGLTASDGTPLTLELTGVRAGDAGSWALTVAGTDARLMGLTVDEWDLGANLSPTTFAGAGTLDVNFDFLRSGGTSQVVALGATFDADGLALTGEVNGSVGITAPGGSTYLTTTDFAGTVDMATTFGTSSWTGAGFSFNAASATYGADGTSMPGTVSDGDDADVYALTGTYDFTTQTVTTIVDQLELVADTMVRLAVAGVALRHTRNGSDEQELTTQADVPVELLFLTVAPATGPPSTEAASVSIRTNGVTIGAGSLTLGSISFDDVMTVTDVSVGFTGFTFLDGTSQADGVSLAADSATLFPAGGTFTAGATNLTGTYDFSSDSDRIGLSAETLSFAIDGLITFDATNVTLRPEGDVVFAAETLAASLPVFGLSGEITGLEITSAGSPSATGFSVDASGMAEALQLGGLLPVSVTGLEVKFLGDDNGNGLRDEGEEFALDAFDLSLSGGFDFDVLGALPFTPSVKIGDSVYDDGADDFSFTMRFSDGAFTPWDVGPIELGVANLGIGESLTFGGSIRLGGYSEGEWVSDFGGTLSISGAAATSNFSGDLTVAIEGTWNDETGVLGIDASFTVGFRAGDYVTVTGAAIDFGMDITTRDAEGDYALGVANLGVGSVSVNALTVNFGEALTLSATAATFNFEAEGSETLLFIGSLSANLPELGFAGEARNFGLQADGSLLLGDNFGVSLSLGEGGTASLLLPDWLPIEVTVFDLQWADLAADPLDFTLRISGSVSTDGLSGSTLTLAGSISNLIIDVGLLKEGVFPIVGLGEVGISVGGSIGGSQIEAALLLGIMRVDAAGGVIADSDTTTEVADRVLWGAVRGGIEIAGYGGLTIYLGLSELGPLQGFVRATVAVPIDPSGLTGLSLTNFRAGITFNTSLPAVTDALELRDNPAFTPVGDLDYNGWRALMLQSLASQIAANAEGGAFAIMTNPFRLDGGVTLFSSYVSTATFRLEADFIMDSTGKFMARGAMVAGDNLSFTANVYLDLSRFIEGETTILFLADFPSEFPLVTVYGGLTFDFGVVIDPENPPANLLEQFSIGINGGLELSLDTMPLVSMEGNVRFDIALNAPSLRTVVDGVASINGLGEVVGIAGDLDLFFGADETVELVGVIALAPGNFAVLQDLGLNFEGVAVLRFNTTADDATRQLTLPTEESPRTFAAPAGSAGLLLEGVLGFSLLDVEVYRIDGTFSFSWSGDTFDVLAAGVLTAGPTAAPLLRLEANGYLKVVFTGIDVGLAALFQLTFNEGDDAFSTVGIELGGEIEFRLNTTGTDVDYALSGADAGTAAVDRIYLPRGPPAPDGTPADVAQSYAMVHAEGTLAVLNVITLEGVFDFAATGEAIDLDYAASLTLQVADTPLLVFAVDGSFRLDSAGLYGEAVLTLNNDAAAATAPLGFNFNATYRLQINTTGVEQTLDGKVLPQGTYARVVATGDLGIDGITLEGQFVITVNDDGLGFAATGTLSLGVGEVELIELGYTGELLVFSDGIYAELTLSRTADGSEAFGFGFSAESSYTLAINTTPIVRNDVPNGLGARVIVDGTLRVGDVSLDGIYTLTATTTGLGFAASAALIFRDGESELFRLPVEFAIEMEIPGIAERIELDIDPAELGLAIPGFDLAGSFYLEINTTPDVVNDIPAGPIFRAGLDGALTLGTLSLEGAWFFDASLSRTQIGGSFDLSLGMPDAAPMITWSGAADFNLGLNGVAGFASLTVESVVSPLEELLDGDFEFELLINTSLNEMEIGDRTLPSGPLAAVKSNGTLNVGGLDFVGEFYFSASPDGVNVAVDADIAVTLADTITLFSFSAAGGFTLDADGIAAAMDLTLLSSGWSDVGLEFEGGAEYRLRINTTGEDRTIGDIELAEGNYTRIEFTGGFSVGTFSLTGDYALTVADSTADLALNGVMEAWLPGAESAAFQLGAVGGLRIDPAGVAAAFDLDTSLTGGMIEIDGVELPFGAEQTVSLRLNTTGEDRFVNGITLDEGNYFAFYTTGSMDLGLIALSGEFGFVAGDTGFAVEARATFGLNVESSEFLRFSVLGSFEITAAGTFASLTLASEAGDGFGDFGFGFGAGTSFTLAFNSTDAEIDDIPARTPWAVRVVGTMTMGDEENGAELVGAFTLTPTVSNTLLLHGETSFVLNIDGSAWLDVPFEFEHEIEFPGLAFRVDLSDILLDFPEIPGVSFEDGEFFLQINVGPDPVEYLGETIPGGPIFQLVYEGTMVVGWAALDGEFAFSASGDGVEMSVGAALRFGDRDDPFLLLGGEGAFEVGSDGFAGRLSVTVTGGVDTVAGPLDGELTHQLFINTRDTGVEVAGVELSAGPMAELRSTGVLNLLGLAFNGTMVTRGSAEGFSMGVDANFEINVPVIGTTLLSIPVLGGFTIGPQGFSAALDVNPTTAFFEPVGLLFGGDASYRLRINTTGEARNENGIDLDQGNYARVDATGTMSLGDLAITGGYSFQVDTDLVRVGVIGAAVLTVPGDGALAGELLRIEVGGEFGIGSAGVVGALDAAVGAGAPQFALGEMSLPVGAENGSRIRLNTTGTERVVAGYTMAANESFMWEVSSGVTLGMLRLEGMNRFTFGDELVRWEHTGRAALLNPLDGAAEILAGEGTIGMEISDAGVAGVATLAGATPREGALDLGLGLDFEAELDLRFNTTGQAVEIGDVTLDAGHYVEAGVSGELQLLGQSIDGTHFVRVADGAVSMRSAGTLTFGIPDVLTMTFGTDINFVFAEDGVYGTAALTVGTSAFSAQGADLGIDAGTTPVFAVNTSSTTQTIGDTTLAAGSVSLGLGSDLTLLGQHFSGQAVLTVDGERGLVVLRQEGSLTLSAGDWSPFTYNYDGYFVFGDGGVLANLDLTLAGGSGVSGVEFDGTWSLRVSTYDHALTIPGFTVGDVTVPELTIEQGPMLRVHLNGSLSLAGMSLNGEFDFEALTDRVVVYADLSISALGISMGGSGQVRLSDAGVVADITLNGPNVSNAFYTMAGDYVLRLNTTSGTVDGIPANSARVAVNHAVISVPGATLRGSASIDFQGGVTLRVDGLTATLDVPMLGGATMTINGWMNSAGQFSVTGTTSLAVGSAGTFGIFGTSTITISHNEGIRGTISNGELHVPGGDYARLNGSFAASMTSFELNVEHTAFVLLGGIVRVDGAFGLTWTDGLFTVWVNDAVATTSIPGWSTAVTINGWINSNGNFDLTGSASLNVGSYPPNEERATLEQRNWTLGLRSTIELNVSNSGISGAVSGLLFVPGDWAGLTGTFSAGSWGFDLAATSRFVLLGGTVLLDGGITVELRNGTLTVGIDDMTAESRIPGFASTFTVDGWINSAGEFDLNGTAEIDVGNTTLGVVGTIAINVSDEGISGSVNGTFYVPGDYNTFSGSFEAGSWGFNLTVDRARFVLLANTVLLDGGMRIELRDGVLSFYLNDVSVESRIPGFDSNFTVDGWINSAGEFDLNGTADIDVGNTTLGVVGTIAINVSDEGISGSVNGTFYVPGDYNTFSGSFEAGSWGFNLTVDRARFVLLANTVLLDGGMRIELRGGVLSFYLNDVSVESRIPGFDSNFTVDGWINSAGEFDLSGTADIAVGSTTLGVQGTIAINVSDDGISGTVNARMYVPGDYADFNGSFEAGSWGFNLTVNRARFALLGGVAILDGGFVMELRNGTLSFWLSNISATIGGVFNTRLDGVIRSDGFFDLDGTASLQLGHWSTVEIGGQMRINVRSDYGVRAWINATAYVRYQEVATLRNAFTYIGRDGFGISVSVNFGFNDARASGTLNLEVRRDGLSASFRGNVSLWGLGGSISGWFDSRHGTWRLSGSVGFSVGGTVGASGRIDIDVGHDRLSFRARGEAWAGFSISYWHWTPVWHDWGRGHWDSQWIGGSTRFDVGFNANSGSFSISVAGKSVHIRFKGGFRVWLSDVGGSTVFLDVNRNGVLDDGEPFTIADANGNFSFDDETAAESDGEAAVISLADLLGPLSGFDTNANGVLDEDEGGLYVVGGIGLNTATTLAAGTRLESGAPTGMTGRAGATVFLDRNGNGTPDEDEPQVLTDALGLYSFAAEALETASPLGVLAEYDANEDGFLDGSEIQLYAVNGLQPAAGSSTVRLFRDANGNGTRDNGEIFADLTLDELSAMGEATAAGNPLDLASSPLRVFDTDGDGVMEESEGQNFVVTEATEVRIPLTAIDPRASGALPLADVDYVFADVNGNGVYDEGEPRVTPNEQGIYTFASGLERDAAAGLGRLASFDRNGNGRIDSDEGVFVVQGGVDNDNGLTNPVGASGLASGYGSGIEQTINPLSSLQVALVDQGISQQEADEIIAGALGLPSGVDIGTFNPMADNGLNAGEAEGATLGAGATITSLITGGAGLLGNSADASAQNTILQSLATVLLADRDGGEGYAIVNLANPDTLNTVLQDAATRTGRSLDASAVNAAATVLAAVNSNIQNTVAAGGDVSRALAATKAVMLTTVSSTLTDLGAGRTSADDAVAAFTAEALAGLIGQVALQPTAAPTMGEITDITARGGDRLVISLPVSDPDTRLSNLQFDLSATPGGIVNLDAATFVYTTNGWQLTLPTVAVASGSTTVTISVSDGTTTVARQFTITLNGINNAVQLIDGLGSQTLSDGQTLNVDLGAVFSDPDGNATYVLQPVGENRVVDARIVNGELVLTANTGLAGVAVFDLVASDELGSATTRFSVVTYPNVLVSEHIQFNAGQPAIEVRLSNPSTQTLVLNYRADGVAGTLVFAAGETSQYIPVDLANINSDGAAVRELEFGVNGTWVSGTFKVALNTYSAVELLGLRRDTLVAVEFTLAYRFITPEAEEEDTAVIVLAPLSVSASDDVVITTSSGGGSAGASPSAATSDLADATSLASLERPRALAGI